MNAFNIAERCAAARCVCTATIALGSLLWLGACRDTERAATSAPAPAASFSAQLIVTAPPVGDSVATATVRVDNPGAVRIASMTATVIYDTLRVHYLGDVPQSDGALRATNGARGRVVVAAAHPTGFDDAALATLRFASRDTLALQAMTLQFTEVHLSDARDVRALMAVSPTRVVK